MRHYSADDNDTLADKGFLREHHRLGFEICDEYRLRVGIFIFASDRRRCTAV